MNRWGDQKYLNHIPNIFSNIKIMTHKGIDAKTLECHFK